MNSSQLDQVLQKPESKRLELKTAEADLGSIAEVVGAFLNGEGGTVVVGVREGGEVESVARPAERVEEIEAFLYKTVSPASVWSVTPVETAQGTVIAIDVPAGSQKPYVCAGAIFVRKGSRTIPADAAAIRSLVSQQYAEPTPWETLPATGLDFEDLVHEEIRRTVDEARERRNYTFREPGNLNAALSDLSLIQSGDLTNGAHVLFGRNPAPRLPQTRIRATVYAKGKGDDFIDDRLFEGCAMSLLDQVFAFVQQNVRVASEFKPGKIAREDRPQYPFSALREGLINAIIHRDYSVYSGGMSVGIYPTRLEIWNTGRLPKGWKIGDLKKDHPSQPANPHMAHVFYLRGIIERVGRGTQKILDECEEAGLRPPQWKEAAGGIQLIFHGASRESRLNQRQQELLRRLKPGDRVRPSEYYSEMEGATSQRQLRRDLSGLETGGWIRKVGQGPATEYVRTDQPTP